MRGLSQVEGCKKGRIETFSTFSIENVRFSQFDYSNYNAKGMNELRFKTQDKHIFIYYVFKVFISIPSLYSIYFTPFCLCETFLDLLR